MRLLAAALLLAGCGSGEGGGNATASGNQIERLSTPRVEKHDPSASARLQPIAVGELQREGLLGAGCDFSSDSAMLLVAVSGVAAVRIEDRLRRLPQSAPVDGTGGFFRDAEISVSVGRSEEIAGGARPRSGWPARITVTNRRTGAQQQLAGVWNCGS
jgi:hypothetical protein